MNEATRQQPCYSRSSTPTHEQRLHDDACVVQFARWRHRGEVCRLRLRLITAESNLIAMLSTDCRTRRDGMGMKTIFCGYIYIYAAGVPYTVHDRQSVPVVHLHLQYNTHRLPRCLLAVTTNYRAFVLSCTINHCMQATAQRRCLRTTAAAAAAVNVVYEGSPNTMSRRAALESAESFSSCITHQCSCINLGYSCRPST